MKRRRTYEPCGVEALVFPTLDTLGFLLNTANRQLYVRRLQQIFGYSHANIAISTPYPKTAKYSQSQKEKLTILLGLLGSHYKLQIISTN